jgi:hypothetical protein
MGNSGYSDALTADRRRVLLNMGVFGCAVGLVGLVGAPERAAAAGSKLSQKAASYQPTSKGKQRCDGCVQWQAPAGCKVVDGTIDPTGWCILYSPK